MKGRLRRNSEARMGRIDFFAILMAFLLFGCVGFQFSARTADGVQCPTAPVQAIVKAIKAPCGCLVGYKISKPQPGDRGFVQCRCAEKKSAEHSPTAVPRSEALVVMAPTIEVPLAIVAPFDVPDFLSVNPPVSLTPAFHPPTLA